MIYFSQSELHHFCCKACINIKNMSDDFRINLCWKQAQLAEPENNLWLTNWLSLLLKRIQVLQVQPHCPEMKDLWRRDLKYIRDITDCIYTICMSEYTPQEDDVAVRGSLCPFPTFGHSPAGTLNLLLIAAFPGLAINTRWYTSRMVVGEDNRSNGLNSGLSVGDSRSLKNWVDAAGVRVIW
jgi:hypothetical protein